MSAIPNANTGTLSWSPDGTFLVFNTSQRTEDTEVVRVELTLKPPKFAEDQFRDLFKEEPDRDRPAPGRGGADGGAGQSRPRASRLRRGARKSKPVEIVFEEIRRRVSVLPVGENYSAETISPDGKWLLVNGAGNLHVYPLDAPPGGGGGGGRRRRRRRQSDASAHDLDRRQVVRAVHARQPGSVLSGSRAHQRRGGRSAAAARRFGDRRARRGLLARKNGGLSPGVDLYARRLLRREVPRRRLGRGSRGVHAGRGGRPHDRRAAPRAEPDVRRVERVASRRLRARRRRAVVEQRPARPVFRPCRIRNEWTTEDHGSADARSGRDHEAGAEGRLSRSRSTASRWTREPTSTRS